MESRTWWHDLMEVGEKAPHQDVALKAARDCDRRDRGIDIHLAATKHFTERAARAEREKKAQHRYGVPGSLANPTRGRRGRR